MEAMAGSAVASTEKLEWVISEYRGDRGVRATYCGW